MLFHILLFCFWYRGGVKFPDLDEEEGMELRAASTLKMQIKVSLHSPIDTPKLSQVYFYGQFVSSPK